MRLDRLPGHDSFGLAEIDVHFAAHSKLAFQVHSGLNPKTCTPHQSAISEFRVVDIRTLSMIFLMNGMSRPEL